MDYLDGLGTDSVDMQTPVIHDQGNWTEDGARTEFGQKTLTPFDIFTKNDRLDQESVHSEEYATKNWNGQVLAFNFPLSRRKRR